MSSQGIAKLKRLPFTCVLASGWASMPNTGDLSNSVASTCCKSRPYWRLRAVGPNLHQGSYLMGLGAHVYRGASYGIFQDAFASVLFCKSSSEVLGHALLAWINSMSSKGSSAASTCCKRRAYVEVASETVSRTRATGSQE